MKTSKRYLLEWLLRRKEEQRRIKEAEVKLNIQNLSLVEQIAKIKEELDKHD